MCEKQLQPQEVRPVYIDTDPDAAIADNEYLLAQGNNWHVALALVRLETRASGTHALARNSWRLQCRISGRSAKGSGSMLSKQTQASLCSYIRASHR